jgi:hypothetical protein
VRDRIEQENSNSIEEGGTYVNRKQNVGTGNC